MYGLRVEKFVLQVLWSLSFVKNLSKALKIFYPRGRQYRTATSKPTFLAVIGTSEKSLYEETQELAKLEFDTFVPYASPLVEVGRTVVENGEVENQDILSRENKRPSQCVSRDSTF